MLHDLHPRSQTLRVLSASELSPVSWTCHDTRNKLRMIKQSFSDFIDIDIDIDDDDDEKRRRKHNSSRFYNQRRPLDLISPSWCRLFHADASCAFSVHEIPEITVHLLDTFRTCQWFKRRPSRNDTVETCFQVQTAPSDHLQSTLPDPIRLRDPSC